MRDAVVPLGNFSLGFNLDIPSVLYLGGSEARGGESVPLPAAQCGLTDRDIHKVQPLASPDVCLGINCR